MAVIFSQFLLLQTGASGAGTLELEPEAEPARRTEDAWRPEQSSTPLERAKRLAQVLNPRDYRPAFLSGAQAEYVGPALGVSSLVFGYDAVWAQVEASAGFVVGDDPLQRTTATDAYNLSLRLAFPVHRGIRADYSLLVGGGASFLRAPQAEGQTLGVLVLGTRFRVFMTPNVATVATLGAAAVFSRDAFSLLVGARPLGAAGVIYFFR